MGTCPYCGNSAGFLRKVHSECKEKHDAGFAMMVETAREAAHTAERLDQLQGTLEAIARASLVPETELRAVLVAGWEKALDAVLEDSVLSSDEEMRLVTYSQHFQLGQAELNKNGGWTRAAMAGTLREILEGKVPSRATVAESLPFNLLKSEKVVWVFPRVRYFEDRNKRHYVGGSHGVSLRVMKGVYYRVGAFRGHAVDTTERAEVDNGMLAITTKHLYFQGSSKRFRIPYAKVVSFEPYSDGIGVQRDAASAKPQTFVTGEGWFVYNAVVNLAKMA